MKHIYLPATGKRITIRNYVAAWKSAKQMDPESEVAHGLNGWWPITVAELLREFTVGMHDRINQAIPYHKRG